MATNVLYPSLLFSVIFLVCFAPSSSTSVSNLLNSGDSLSTNEFLSYGNYSFIMQGDCNLVLYNGKIPTWSSHTNGKATGCVLTFNNYGELVIVSRNKYLVWRSETGGDYGRYVLILQPNGDVVVYGEAVWSTGTFTQITTMNSKTP